MFKQEVSKDPNFCIFLGERDPSYSSLSFTEFQCNHCCQGRFLEARLGNLLDEHGMQFSIKFSYHADELVVSVGLSSNVSISN